MLHLLEILVLITTLSVSFASTSHNNIENQPGFLTYDCDALDFGLDFEYAGWLNEYSPTMMDSIPVNELLFPIPSTDAFPEPGLMPAQDANNKLVTNDRALYSGNSRHNVHPNKRLRHSESSYSNQSLTGNNFDSFDFPDFDNLINQNIDARFEIIPDNELLHPSASTASFPDTQLSAPCQESINPTCQVRSPQQQPTKKRKRGPNLDVGLFDLNVTEISDYFSLCKFLNKSPSDDEFHLLDSHGVETSLSVEECQEFVLIINDQQLDMTETERLSSATSTLEILILIANLFRKFASVPMMVWKESEHIEFLKAWKYQVCVPVLKCVMRCCNKNLGLFQDRWGNPFKVWQFKKIRCRDICAFKTQKKLTRKAGIFQDLVDIEVTNITDYDSLCAFLRKQPDASELQFLTTSVKDPTSSTDAIIIKDRS